MGLRIGKDDRNGLPGSSRLRDPNRVPDQGRFRDPVSTSGPARGLPSLAAYAALLDRLDAHEKRLRARYGRHIVCAEGCADCCSLGSLFSVEAYSLFLFIRRSGTDVKGRPPASDAARRPRTADRCPLLLGDRCSVYAARPVICRTHGYPLLIDGKLDHCPKNFTALRTIESRFILDLDAVDTALAEINIAFMKENGDRRFRRVRTGIDDLLHILRSGSGGA